jgi:hypothetical protein
MFGHEDMTIEATAGAPIAIRPGATMIAITTGTRTRGT